MKICASRCYRRALLVQERWVRRALLSTSVLFFSLGATASALPKQYEKLKPKIAAYAEKIPKNSYAGAESPQIDDPRWYGGNNLGAIEMVLDMLRNLEPSNFFDCFNFEMYIGFGSKNYCYKKKLGVKFYYGFPVWYRWPLHQVLSHRSGQNRYLPEFLVNLSNELRQELHYQAAASIHAPLQKNLAHLRSSLPVNMNPAIMLSGEPILPKLEFEDTDIDLEGSDERFRFDGGALGKLDHLEYTLLPSALQVAWKVLVEYLPILKLLPCTPPTKVAAPFMSELPGVVELTRNPLLGFALHKDVKLRKDLLEWILDPDICTSWMMMNSKQNIASDLYSTAKGLASFFPAPIDPLKNGAWKYSRMCTENWGASIPFTVSQALHHDPFVSAGKNFEKSLRLARAIDLTFLKWKAAGKHVRYYGFNKQVDRYQLTYPESWECKQVGQPGNPLEVKPLEVEHGEYGLVSMTHWKQLPLPWHKCCFGTPDPAKALEFLEVIASIGMMLENFQNYLNIDFWASLMIPSLSLFVDIEFLIDFGKALECFDDVLEQLSDFVENFESLQDLQPELQALFEKFQDLLTVPGGEAGMLALFQDAMVSFEALIAEYENLPIVSGEVKQLSITKLVEQLEAFKDVGDVLAVLDVFESLSKAKQIVSEELEKLFAIGDLELDIDTDLTPLEVIVYVGKILGEVISRTYDWIDQKIDDSDIDFGEIENWDKLDEVVTWEELTDYMGQTFKDVLWEKVDEKFGGFIDYAENLPLIYETVDSALATAALDTVGSIQTFLNGVKTLKEIHTFLKSADLDQFDVDQILEDLFTFDGSQSLNWLNSLIGKLQAVADALEKIEAEIDLSLPESGSPLAVFDKIKDELDGVLDNLLALQKDYQKELAKILYKARQCLKKATSNNGSPFSPTGL